MNALIAGASYCTRIASGKLLARKRQPDLAECTDDHGTLVRAEVPGCGRT
jgi:hypothetical protein